MHAVKVLGGKSSFCSPSHRFTVAGIGLRAVLSHLLTGMNADRIATALHLTASSTSHGSWITVTVVRAIDAFVESFVQTAPPFESTKREVIQSASSKNTLVCASRYLV